MRVNTDPREDRKIHHHHQVCRLESADSGARDLFGVEDHTTPDSTWELIINWSAKILQPPRSRDWSSYAARPWAPNGSQLLADGPPLTLWCFLEQRLRAM